MCCASCAPRPSSLLSACSLPALLPSLTLAANEPPGESSWQDILVGTLLGHACCFVAFRLRFPSPTLGRGLVPHAQDGAPLRVADSSMSKQHTSPASEPV